MPYPKGGCISALAERSLYKLTPSDLRGSPHHQPPSCSKTLQRNRKMGMGRKKFNMDPKKVLGGGEARTPEFLPGPGSCGVEQRA